MGDVMEQKTCVSGAWRGEDEMSGQEMSVEVGRRLDGYK